MPQATEELRKAWGGYKGIGEDKAIEYLESKGYIIDYPSYEWIKPNPDHIPTEAELAAAWFLVTEWDWGDIR